MGVWKPWGVFSLYIGNRTATGKRELAFVRKDILVASPGEPLVLL